MHGTRRSPVDLTRRFTELPLNRSNLVIQKPYDLPESTRYSFVDGVHKLWVSGCTPPTNLTPKRVIPIRIKGFCYSSGVWQFNLKGGVLGQCLLQAGLCIMQVCIPSSCHILMVRA
ncbi:Citrate-binding protein [Spatholobus suberectus]|nr:Citrate-binding protein [Spatholobus suberectus]